MPFQKKTNHYLHLMRAYTSSTLAHIHAQGINVRVKNQIAKSDESIDAICPTLVTFHYLLSINYQEIRQVSS